MKIIKLSLESIKLNQGDISPNTGVFNKVLPYYLRKIEDIAVQLFESRLTDSSEDCKHLDKGGEHE